MDIPAEPALAMYEFKVCLSSVPCRDDHIFYLHAACWVVDIFNPKSCGLLLCTLLHLQTLNHCDVQGFLAVTTLRVEVFYFTVV